MIHTIAVITVVIENVIVGHGGWQNAIYGSCAAVQATRSAQRQCFRLGLEQWLRLIRRIPVLHLTGAPQREYHGLDNLQNKCDPEYESPLGEQ